MMKIKNSGYQKKIPEQRVTPKRKRALHPTVLNVLVLTGALAGSFIQPRLSGYLSEIAKLQRVAGRMPEVKRFIHAMIALQSAGSDTMRNAT